jgi:hypothetical protein
MDTMETDEMLLVRTRRRLRALAAQLEVAPFAPSTTAAMRAYLREDAESAGEAFARWCALSPMGRMQRIIAAGDDLS